jgi:O-antigen ligase
MSVPGAEDLARAWHKWLKFLVYSMCFMFTLVTLGQEEAKLDRFYRAFMVAGVGLVVVLYLHLAHVLWTNTEFIPAQQLKEDDLPFLLPFLLYGLQRVANRKYRIALGTALLLSVLFYIMLAEGRAALLALFVGLVLYAVLVARWRLGTVLLPVILLATGLIAMVSATHVESAAKDKESWTETLDRISSGRTILWRQAFVYPPTSVVTGVGMGNGRYAEKALTLHEGQQVKHFHNLFVDTWYETGLLGLIAITTWLVFVLARAWGDWQKSAAEDRRQIGLLLSSSFAILTAAQLGPSYSSSLVSVYLMILFAALTIFHGRLREAAVEPRGR